MSENNHPIQLEQVIFTRSIVIAVRDHQPGDIPKICIGPENGIHVLPIDGQEGKYQASMTSKFNTNADAAYPYIVDMECLGIFLADPDRKSVV